MMRRWVLAGLAASGLCAGGVRAQESADGPSLVLDGRVQTLLTTTSVSAIPGAPAPDPIQIGLRRVYMGARFDGPGPVSGTVQVDLASGTLELVDAFGDIRFTPHLFLRVGRFKKPFGMLALYRHPQLLLLERGLTIRGAPAPGEVAAETQVLLKRAGYVGRETGIMVHAAAGSASLDAGLFTARGPGGGPTAPGAAAGRVAYGVGPHLRFGAGISHQRWQGFPGGDRSGTMISADAEWGDFRRPGLRVLAELEAGDNLLPPDRLEATPMVGGQVMVGWHLPRAGTVEAVEPVLRVGWADPDMDEAGEQGVLVSAGANLYLEAETRVMVNGEAYASETGAPVYALLVSLLVVF